MEKFFVIVIKGVVGLIWLLATIVMSVLLSPFIFIIWISKIIVKKKAEVAERHESKIKSPEMSHYDY